MANHDEFQREQQNQRKENDEQRIKREYLEEAASELAEDDVVLEDRDQSRADHDVNSTYGWVAVALSIISFFFIPLLFAGAGIILGFIARNRNASILGNTAIIIGILSIVIRLFILPLL